MAHVCSSDTFNFMASHDQEERLQTMQENAEAEAKRKAGDKQGQARTRGEDQEQGEEEKEEEEAREEEGEEGEEEESEDDSVDEEDRGPRTRSRSPSRLVRTNTAFCEPCNPERFRVWDPSPSSIKIGFLRDWFTVNRPDMPLDGKLIEIYFHPSQRNKLWREFEEKMRKETARLSYVIYRPTPLCGSLTSGWRMRYPR